MADLDWVALGLRMLHILAAITAAGGAIFCRFALLPGLAQVSPDARKDVHEHVRRRWSKIVAGAILVLLVSGFINFFNNLPMFKDEAYASTKRLYNIVWGVKFLLALGVFFLASVLSGRSQLADKFRLNARMWLSLNVGLIVIIVGLSAVLRSTHNEPKLPTAINAPQ